MNKLLSILMALILIISQASASPIIQCRHYSISTRLLTFISEPKLEIIFPKVQNCDAAIIRFSNRVILIDCASNAQVKNVVEMLKDFNITHIDYLINTHPHYDHIEGLEQLVQQFIIKKIYFCFPENINETSIWATNIAKENNIPVYYYNDNNCFVVENLSITALLKNPTSNNINERSAVLSLKYKNSTMLFTADILKGTMKILSELQDKTLLDADIIKYPHHGKDPLFNDFLKTVSPQLAIITNSAGTASKKSRDFLKKNHIPYFTTNKLYTYLVTDGEIWFVSQFE